MTDTNNRSTNINQKLTAAPQELEEERGQNKVQHAENNYSRKHSNKVTIYIVIIVTVITPVSLVYLTTLSAFAIIGITIASVLAVGMLVSTKLNETSYSNQGAAKGQQPV
jgi:hypothetical protein